jgi:metal-responsive CopG/Arc/MetJ family transcriptional regulator
MMATIQVVIDDELLRRLDCELQGAQRGRSAFVRAAIERELAERDTHRLEEEHRLSCARRPETADDVAELESWSRLSAQSLADDPWDAPDQ